MKFDSEMAESVDNRYRFEWVDLVADDLSVAESDELRSALGSTPFVWMEGVGTRSYYARLVLPSAQLAGSLRSLRRLVASVNDRIRWFVLDQAHALSFSLPSQLYDDGRQSWGFQKEEALQKFETLMKARHGIVYGHLPPRRKKA